MSRGCVPGLHARFSAERSELSSPPPRAGGWGAPRGDAEHGVAARPDLGCFLLQAEIPGAAPVGLRGSEGRLAHQRDPPPQILPCRFPS